jgi:hypothetical protein
MPSRHAPAVAGEGLLEHGGRIERLVEPERTAIDDQRQAAVGRLAVVTEAQELRHPWPRQAGKLAPLRPAQSGQLLDEALQLFHNGHAGTPGLGQRRQGQEAASIWRPAARSS